MKSLMEVVHMPDMMRFEDEEDYDDYGEDVDIDEE